MHVQYARCSAHSAELNSEFGLNYTMKIFGKNAQEIEQIVGRYSRGKQKGQLRGTLRWYRCDVGGWVNGGVRRPGERFGHELLVNGINVKIGPSGREQWLKQQEALEQAERKVATSEDIRDEFKRMMDADPENPTLEIGYKTAVTVVEEFRKELERVRQGSAG